MLPEEQGCRAGALGVTPLPALLLTLSGSPRLTPQTEGPRAAGGSMVPTQLGPEASRSPAFPNLSCSEPPSIAAPALLTVPTAGNSPLCRGFACGTHCPGCCGSRLCDVQQCVSQMKVSLWEGESVLRLLGYYHKIIFKSFSEVSCREEKYIVSIRDFNHTRFFNPS